MGNRTHKILIADDSAEMREALAALLDFCEVTTAADGSEALRLAAAEKPALILLDINMPGLNGLQVLEMSAGLRPRPLVVMITAETDLETGIKAVSLGSYAYLTKPFDAERVRETVASALAEFDRRNP